MRRLPQDRIENRRRDEGTEKDGLGLLGWLPVMPVTRAICFERGGSTASSLPDLPGFDHPQWEIYSSSKHGVRAALKQLKVLPGSVAAPTCQTCHMQEGNHSVQTAWGFLALRLPLSEDKQHAEFLRKPLRDLRKE